MLKALALGAAFVWIGRPFNYAATIGGRDGVRHAIELMQAEIERDMMMLGIRALDELGPHAVKRADGTGVAPRRGGSPAIAGERRDTSRPALPAERTGYPRQR